MEYLGRVAVITRTKNRIILLERALNSVLNQTFEDWFLVVVNDGGERAPVDDLIEQYAARFAGRIAVIHNETSKGMEAASNCGIAYGDSEYVVIHDDDDSWTPNFLLMSVNDLEHTRNILPTVQGVVCYSHKVLERIERGRVIIEDIQSYNQWLPKGVLSYFRMSEGNVFPPISFLYSREALRAVGDYNPQLPVLGDWEFNLRFMAQYDICVVPHSLAFYHHRVAMNGDMSNSVYGGANKHILYDQYLRNELLRRDLRGESNGTGLLVNEAQRFGWVLDRLNAMTEPLSVTGAPASIEGRRWLPVWYVASVMTFLRSSDRSKLFRKFMRHWREENPQRALAVVARFGYLAMGGK